MSRFSFTTRAAPKLQIGLGSSVELSSSLWDVALWDAPTSKWAGVEPTWRTVDCDAIEVRAEAGRARITDPFNPGRAEIIVDNASGWADPTIADDAPGVLSMRPGRAIRVGIEHATLGTRWLWRGFIDAVEPIYSPEDWDTVMLRCFDAFGEAGRAKLYDTVDSGANETATTRFTRILNKIRWPGGKRIVDAASTELFAATLEGQVVDLLRRTADSCGGWAFGDTAGRVVMRNRDWLFYENGAAPDATIGNVDVGDVCPIGFARSFDRKAISTQVTIDRTPPIGEPPTNPIEFNDEPGQILYGVEPYERLDLWTRDNSDAAKIGTRILVTRNAKSSMPRVSAVSLDASTSDAAIDLMTQVSVFTPSRYRCRFQRPSDGAEVFDDEFFAVGVVHEITADSWLCHISLDRSGFYEELDPPPYLWDVATWNQALWN
jgi:hypothetical protein